MPNKARYVACVCYVSAILIVISTSHTSHDSEVRVNTNNKHIIPDVPLGRNVLSTIEKFQKKAISLIISNIILYV